MLKSLELLGFKSFADKTQFAFASGITAVVGPNGSGKSNVVDAIKWVLGEQSAKSLRGKEMADVIFNGSGTRKPLNSAEVTLTFDNSSGILPIETPEVHITRRVYRSGESEYLINRQPSRLKHIRDLFMGTGAATDAYSVIEQGKVDVLLQSSPKERREIFEEAAGISRFKAKKLESLRRLDRVEQNLLRLADIVEEVENQLRSVRNQAGKAKRYREYNQRLQALRTQVGFADYKHLSEKLDELEQDLHQRREAIAAQAAEAEKLEQQSDALENKLASFNERLQQAQQELTGHRERIAAGESTIENEHLRIADLQQEIRRYRRQLASLSYRNEDLQHQLSAAKAAEAEARQDYDVALQRLKEGERTFTELMGTIEEAEHLQTDYEQRLREQLRAVASLGNEISSLESQVKAADQAHQQVEKRLSALDHSRQELEAELTRHEQEEQRRQQQVERETGRLAQLQHRLESRREERTTLQGEISRLQGRISGTAERIDLLEDLEKRLVGVSAGVKQILADAQAHPRGPYGSVRGLVADLFQVSVETAPLIEIALGETAQYLVITQGKRLINHLAKKAPELEGRVSFVRLDVIDPEPDAGVDLSRERGVIGRADHFVETDAEYRPLVHRLLGKTWIVETLADAFDLSSHEGVEFVTLSGEALKADGTISVGPRQTTDGIISRRSELRELQARHGELAAEADQQEQKLADLKAEIEADEARLQEQADKQRSAVEALTSIKHQASITHGRLGQLTEQRDNLQGEAASSSRHRQQVEGQLRTAREQLGAAESQVGELEREILQAQQQLNHLEASREDHATEVTSAKIQVAKSEERLEGLRNRLRQLEGEQEERSRALEESVRHLRDSEKRHRFAFWNILSIETELAELYLKKDAIARDSVDIVSEREAVQAERSQLVRETQKFRQKIRKLEEELHARDLEVNEIRHRRSTLVERLRDDYGIDVSQLEAPPSEEELHEREAAEQEIEDLRQKISRLGNVNLDALEQLDELDVRFNTLSGQHADLTEAKRTLEEIIEKINTDSRRLFSETLEAVRVHFQELFRKLFGGGNADIVTEEGGDILECGIEVIARPPGKELRSISLLSGGEKTLTCVALLLAIFRNRPSPFCVLDEVDAALDEANIDRFVGVVKEFAEWTQFIIITHSKRTMTGASTLYGVTMQESGISKRVSVRFEDVNERGELLATAEKDDLASDEEAA